MNLEAPFDSITLEVDPKEQQDLKELIEQQERKEDISKTLGGDLDKKKICSISWK